MALDLDTLGYVSGELSGFFAHLSKAFLQKRDAGTLPPSLFSASSGSLALVPVPAKGKPGRPKKAKKDRAPRAVSAYNHFMKEKMLELSQNGNHEDGRTKFDEVTKMWSAMSPEAKHAYTEDFKAKVARGEISTVPARLLPAASAPMDAAADAMVSPPEVDAATGSPSKKKKKRKDMNEPTADEEDATEAILALPAAAGEGAHDDAPVGEKKKKKKKKKHSEAAPPIFAE